MGRGLTFHSIIKYFTYHLNEQTDDEVNVTWVLAPDSFAAQLLGLGGAGAGAGDCDEEWALEPAWSARSMSLSEMLGKYLDCNEDIR